MLEHKTALRIATRGSNLALWQANFVASLLSSLDLSLRVELVRVATTADRARDASLDSLGVGVFTREIQQAVLDGRADIAVHSLKDLPTVPVEAISLAAVPERASPWDALVLPGASSEASGIKNLPADAKIGTGSYRRRAQLLFLRPDLQFVETRGNVETRLRKLDEGACDALVLAEAGLDRLGLSGRISARLSSPELLPAAGQGALGIECRSDDVALQSLLARLSHPPTRAQVTAERRVLARLGAGCHAPLGVAAAIEGNELTLEAVVLSPDGQRRLHAKDGGPVSDAVPIGDRVAEHLLDQGAGPLIEAAG